MVSDTIHQQGYMDAEVRCVRSGMPAKKGGVLTAGASSNVQED